MSAETKQDETKQDKYSACRNAGCDYVIDPDYTLCDECGPWQYAEQPSFVVDVQPLSGTDIAAVIQGGCASGAWMPAVTYNRAAEILRDHEGEVFVLLEDAGIDPATLPGASRSYRQFGCDLVSAAVEVWCARWADHAGEVLWNDDHVVGG